MHSRNSSAGASTVAPVLSNFGRMNLKIGPRPAMDTRLSVSISQRCDRLLGCLFHAVDGHVFLPFECLHYYWCEFCQSCVQRRVPCWVDDPRRSWGIGVSVDSPCHSVEFSQKPCLLWVVGTEGCRRNSSPASSCVGILHPCALETSGTVGCVLE